MSAQQPHYLLVDVDDNHHTCYVTSDLAVAVVQASEGLHLYAPVGKHNDDVAVQRFSQAMKDKLAKSREKGRGGWEDPEQCSTEFLCDMLIGHLGKGNDGNFEDIANFAMMLHQRGDSPIKLAEAKERLWPMTVFLPDGREVGAPYDDTLLGFSHEGTWIINPFVSDCSRFPVSPTVYGFTVWDSGVGVVGYRRDLPNNDYILLTVHSQLPDKPGDEDDAILTLYNSDGVELAAINVCDIPMGG